MVMCRCKNKNPSAEKWVKALFKALLLLMAALSKEDKQKLIDYIVELKLAKSVAMRRQAERQAKNCEAKVLRRLNNVSVTLRKVKLKDALEVERHHKPQLRSLLLDVEKLHRNEL